MGYRCSDFKALVHYLERQFDRYQQVELVIRGAPNELRCFPQQDQVLILREVYVQLCVELEEIKDELENFLEGGQLG